MEFEQAALGALLLKPDEALEHAEMLTVDAFYDKAHSLIYTTIAGLAEGQNPIDLVTVTESLKDKGELNDIGGVSYLAKLAGEYQLSRMPVTTSNSFRIWQFAGI